MAEQGERQESWQGRPGGEDKELYDRFPNFTAADLDRLTILPEGTELQQGAVYFDLNKPGGAPFKAIGGDVARAGSRLIAKQETDYEIWNRVVPQDRNEETQPIEHRPRGA
jgi:hypothetical protein